MKTVVISILLLSIISLSAAEPQVVPAEPPLAEVRKQAEAATIVLVCKPNAAGTGLAVSAVLKGQEEFDAAKDQIAKLIPKSDSKALSKDGYRELIFIDPPNGRGDFKRSHSVALWPQYEEIIGGHKVRFLSHDLTELKRVIRGTEKKAQQDGADQPATALESKSDDKEKPEPESEVRPQ